MEDIYARAYEADFLAQADRERWLADARSKGIDASGTFSHLLKTAIHRLALTIGV